VLTYFTTEKHLFTVNTTLLILMLISLINKVICFNQAWSSSGHLILCHKQWKYYSCVKNAREMQL